MSYCTVTILPTPGKCIAVTYKRDTLRYTGRGKGGFEMHYIKTQCSRNATKDGFCWQHHSDYIPLMDHQKREIEQQRADARKAATT